MAKKQQRAFINYSKAILKSYNEKLHGAFIDIDNRLCATDSYIAIRLFTDNIADCPMLENQQKQVDLSWFFEKDKYNREITIDVESMMNQYKEFTKNNNRNANVTRENKGIYVIDCGSDKIAVNIKYLKRLHDILNFSKNCTFHVTPKKKKHMYNIDPLFIQSDVGEAIIMPIRINE